MKARANHHTTAGTSKDLNPFANYSQTRLQELAKEFSKAKPFSHLSLPNFVDETFLEQVKTEVMGLKFNEKSNDLFHFMQSDDLKAITNNKSSVAQLRDILYSTQFRGALETITGIKLHGLSKDVSVNAAIYNSGDRLLCHDDELEGRRIAFIIYMVPRDWNQADAGHLDLFQCAENNHPTAVAKSLLPAWNTFNFFEVSPISYHQVREVLSQDKERVSISGWFHGEPIKRKPEYVEPIPASLKLKQSGQPIEDWV